MQVNHFFSISGRYGPWLLFALTIPWGCKKTPEPVVSGRVYEYGTDIPIPDATVKLYEVNGTFLGTFSYKLIDETTTSSDGSYLTQYNQPKGVLVANAYKDGFFSDTDTENGIENRPDTDANIYLYPYSWIQIHAINESGAYEFVPESNSSSSPTVIIPKGRDTLLLPKLVKGNKNYSYIFSVRPQNGGLPLKDYSNVQIIIEDKRVYPIVDIGATFLDLFPKGHDTIFITIKY